MALGKLVTFFSKLRPAQAAPASIPLTGHSANLIKTQYAYTHPRSYASMGEYKAFSRLTSGAEGLAGTVSSLDPDADDQDDLWIMSTLPSKTKTKPERVRVTLNPKDQPAYYKPPPQARSELYLKDITHMLPISPRLAAVYTYALVFFFFSFELYCLRNDDIFLPHDHTSYKLSFMNIYLG